MREKIQQQAEELLIANKDVGICCLGMGLGKSLIAINRIKNGGYKNILITGYRTALKENWINELNKWAEYYPGLRSPNNLFIHFKLGENICGIWIDNIQTCYKWTKEFIQQFDLIILDEIHELATEEYGKLIVNAAELNISRIGLSGTPDLKNKKEFYDKYCPILMEYYDVEGEITNEVNVIVYEYELSDDYKVVAGTKDKKWYVGEKKQYEYIDKVFQDNKKLIEDFYFAEVKQRCINRLDPLKANIYTPFLEKDEFLFLEEAVSKDLKYFYEYTKPRYEAGDLSTNLYWALKNIKGWNYSILGTKGINYLSSEEFPKLLKPFLSKYCWAMRARKEFLWNLESSKTISLQLKNKILGYGEYHNYNKILLFSELTTQAGKLSPYQFHSKTGKTVKESNLLNKEVLKKFNSGEIREIASVNSLTSGVNLVGCNYVIVESFNSSDVKSNQIRGRLRRLGLQDAATLIIIVPKQTQAYTWYLNSYGEMNYKVINSIEELKV